MADHEKRQADALERIAGLLESIDRKLERVPGRKPPDRPKPQKKKTPAQLEQEFYERGGGD